MDKASGVDKPLVPVRAWVWMGAFHVLCAMRKKQRYLHYSSWVLLDKAVIPRWLWAISCVLSLSLLFWRRGAG